MVQLMSDVITSEREHLLIDALHVMETPGTLGTDQYLNAYAQAMGNLVVSGEYKEAVDSILNRDIEASYLAHLAARAIAKQAMPWRPAYLKDWYPHFADIVDAPRLGDEFDFPRGGFDRPEMWEVVLERILNSRSSLNEFSSDLMWRHMATNVAPRYKGVKIATAHMEAPRILDIGCSQNLGLKQLAMVDELPFDPIKVGSFGEDQGEVFIEQPRLSEDFNRVVNGSQNLGMSLGVDFFPLTDIENHFWARACFRPSELLDEKFIRHFDRLSAEAPPNVGFVRGDASMVSPEFSQDLPPAHQFDVVSMLTFMYLLKKEEQRQVLSHADSYVAADGVVVWQDFFVDIDPGNPITPRNIYTAGSNYYTLVKDMREPGLGFQELIKWNRGRGEEAQINLDTYDRLTAS